MMSELSRETVPLSDGAVSCLAWKADGPLLHFAHANGFNAQTYRGLLSPLSDRFHIVASDARGHGRSDAPEQGYGPAEQAADLAGVISALGLHRPAVLGHSMGAATTLALAGAYPDVPRAILLEDPPAWWVAFRGSRDRTMRQNWRSR